MQWGITILLSMHNLAPALPNTAFHLCQVRSISTGLTASPPHRFHDSCKPRLIAVRHRAKSQDDKECLAGEENFITLIPPDNLDFSISSVTAITPTRSRPVMAGGFVAYHEPGSKWSIHEWNAGDTDISLAVVEILIIISFFFLLSLAEWISAKIIRAGIIGQIAVGIIYGKPLADILEYPWQKTFLVVGYVGLILIIFEGGIELRMGLVLCRETKLIPIQAVFKYGLTC